MSKECYEFGATYFSLTTEEQKEVTLTVGANTKWGAWTKAVYAAMEKETDNMILVEIDLVFG